jgi:hypothetical protein
MLAKETLGLVHFAVQRYDDGSIHGLTVVQSETR